LGIINLNQCSSDAEEMEKIPGFVKDRESIYWKISEMKRKSKVFNLKIIK